VPCSIHSLLPTALLGSDFQAPGMLSGLTLFPAFRTTALGVVWWGRVAHPCWLAGKGCPIRPADGTRRGTSNSLIDTFGRWKVVATPTHLEPASSPLSAACVRGWATSPVRSVFASSLILRRAHVPGGPLSCSPASRPSTTTCFRHSAVCCGPAGSPTHTNILYRQELVPAGTSGNG
ncbi:unnamed protein product, partial [Ectocarpus sp. 13 AM-2016]